MRALGLALSTCDFHLLRIFRRHRGALVDRSLRWDIEESVELEDEDGSVRLRNLPGNERLGSNQLPVQLNISLNRALLKFDPVGLRKDSAELRKLLTNRRAPAKEQAIRARAKALERGIKERDDIKFRGSKMSSEEKSALQKDLQEQVLPQLRSEFYRWKPINYTPYLCAQYIVSRFPEEYAVLSKILTEITSRRPDFHPQSLLDFGSGVGTVPFAASGVFGKSLNEYVLVDSSPDMLNLSKEIIDNDTKGEDSLLNQAFHRQFLPGLRERQYDVVVSAYSLLELSGVKERLKTVRSLWQKTKRFLVLVELGSTTGYSLIMEARNHLLQVERSGKKSSRRSNFEGLDEEDIAKLLQNTPEPAEVFSPCPHKLLCPRETTASTSDVVCHFPISFQPLPFMSHRNTPSVTSRYSYVVLEKYPSEGLYEEQSEHWPRLVESVIKRHHHSVCRLCCSDGTLKEMTCTKDKHQGALYNFSRQARWGDRAPFVFSVRSPEEQEAYDQSLRFPKKKPLGADLTSEDQARQSTTMSTVSVDLFRTESVNVDDQDYESFETTEVSEKDESSSKPTRAE